MSAAKVLEDQRQGQKNYEDWVAVKVKFHIKASDDPQVYDNYLGPICVTKAAFDATPGAVQSIDSAGELSERISRLISRVRAILNNTDETAKTGYQGYYLERSR